MEKIENRNFKAKTFSSLAINTFQLLFYDCYRISILSTFDFVGKINAINVEQEKEAHFSGRNIIKLKKPDKFLLLNYYQ